DPEKGVQSQESSCDSSNRVGWLYSYCSSAGLFWSLHAQGKEYPCLTSGLWSLVLKILMPDRIFLVPLPQGSRVDSLDAWFLAQELLRSGWSGRVGLDQQ